jgi:predicted metal-dependent HD superfamily phosphohydrolase
MSSVVNELINMHASTVANGKDMLRLVEQYVRDFFAKNMPAEYVYHDITHTEEVVAICRQLALNYSLKKEDVELLEIAAWLHDIGYDKGPENHEDRSVAYAEEFLAQFDFPKDKFAIVAACIKATKMPQTPKSLLEEIICDADLSHLGDKTYWMRTARLRQELMYLQGKSMTEDEWLDFELEFMIRQHYHTDAAKELFERRKVKHIIQLRKHKMRLQPDLKLSTEDIFIFNQEEKEASKWKAIAKQSKLEIKNYSLGRGVETMYRTTYNTHNNLSALADHKANLMLSINTIMISITVSLLVPQLSASPQLILPTITMLLVCLVSIVFATLSTRPKVTHGEISIDDIRNKRSNLLFFGNFHNMKLEDFQWGMTEMIKDADFQYSSMTRDLYYLGKVLAQKYRYLTICYNVFMFGLILSVLLFGYAFLTSDVMPNLGFKK